MTTNIPQQCDVVVIGGGPAGSVAAAMLAQKGWQVSEMHFPLKRNRPFGSLESALHRSLEQWLRRCNLGQPTLSQRDV